MPSVRSNSVLNAMFHAIAISDTITVSTGDRHHHRDETELERDRMRDPHAERAGQPARRSKRSNSVLNAMFHAIAISDTITVSTPTCDTGMSSSHAPIGAHSAIATS